MLASSLISPRYGKDERKNWNPNKRENFKFLLIKNSFSVFSS